ncbi:MAG: hypothetical protein ABI707_05990 [Ferruginibacter sp.]
MRPLSKKTNSLISLSLLFVLAMYIPSCKKDDLSSPDNNIVMEAKLSDYKIFQGKLSDLNPSDEFKHYEIATGLFSDYAEKQRLVKIPGGHLITAVNNGLPDFPDGTMLVKTFYYYNDKKDTAKGKKIVETRLLIQSNSKWNVAVYLWNNEQTDAYLLTIGLDKTINWINERGEGKVISYHVPNNRECATCHNSKGTIIPIGVKIRNLNFEVERNSRLINQLIHFGNIGIMNSVDPSSFSSLPNWQDTAVSVENRARAYLDINCAHCHNKNGIASGTGIFLGYELTLDETSIIHKKKQIQNAMSDGVMPKLGTTIIDEEALLLIKKYIEHL